MNDKLIPVIVLIVTIGAGAAWFKSCLDSPRTDASLPAPVAVSAEKLIAAYQANEIAAEARYGGTTWKIYGIVREVGRDIRGTPYVLLSASGTLEIPSVQCYFARAEETRLAALRPGQAVVLSGQPRRKLLHVRVDGCQVVN